MKAIIQYTDCAEDAKIVFGTLAQLGAYVVRADYKSGTMEHNITLCIKDIEEINNIMFALNKNTDYGVRLIYCKETFWNKIKKKVFKNE